MSKKIKNNLIVLLFIVFVFTLSAFFICFVALSKAESEGIKVEYQLNEKLNIPDKNIIHNATQIEAEDYYLIYPNGLKVSGRTHTLDVAGKYTIEYYAYKDGEIIKETKTFIVRNDVFSVTGAKSSFSFGVNKLYPKAPEGLKVSIANGEKFKYNQIIDLSNKTKKDNLLSFYFTPMQSGTYDASNLIVRFTDIHDSSNYVDVIYKCLYATRDWAKYHTYIVAQSSGNVPVGGKYVNKDFGWATYQTFCGVYSPYYGGKQVGEDPYNLMFDYENKQIWTDHLPASATDAGTPYIADLDDSSIFAEPWKGFTTGEVYMSIFATSYQNSTMNFTITYLDGCDFSKKSFVDEQAPSISINMDGEENVPNGIKGVPYKIFEAKATDDYSVDVKVKANVYYRYGTTSQSSVYVKNGYFTPQMSGVYTIEYVSEDSFSNKTVKTVEVTVLSNLASNKLDFETNNFVSQGESGTAIKCFDIEVFNEKGNYNITATAINSNGRFVLDENYTFVPLYAGSYTIEVVVIDYVETVTKQVGVLEITAGANPVFNEDVSIPKYFITGQKYTINDQTGYDLTSGEPRELVAKTFIVQDDGQEMELNGPFTVTAEDRVKIIYRLTNAQGTVDRVRIVKAINPINGEGNLDITKYFDIESGVADIVAGKNSTTISTDEKVRFTFINPIQAEKLNVQFVWDYQLNNFENLTFYLTDSVDSSVQIKVNYFWKDGSCFMLLNDQLEVPVTKDKSSTDYTRFALGYINETKQFYARTSLKKTIVNDCFGKVFNGFKSNLVYLTIEMSGVYKQSSFEITKINNQAIYDEQAPDTIWPEIIIKESRGDIFINGEVIIHGARAYDVLSSYTDLVLVIYDPDGNIVVDIDGNLLDESCNPYVDHKIIVNKYGNYSVMYTATDAEGNSEDYYYGISVLDLEAPTLNLDVSNVHAKVGSKIHVRNYNTSDNLSIQSEIKTYVHVIAPDYSIVNLKDKTFVADKKGEYTVYYYCYDAVGNLTVKHYKIVVS